MLFGHRGLHVTRAAIGDGDPLLAIEDELRTHHNAHDHIILSTLPPGRSRWLQLDAHLRAARLALPVTHVYEGCDQAAADGFLSERPLGTRLRALVARFGRPFERWEPGMGVIALLMLAYLGGALMLALTVDRRFFLNDAIALVAFGTLLIGLTVFERLDAQPGNGPAAGAPGEHARAGGSS